jgi:hypothetical protein
MLTARYQVKLAACWPIVQMDLWLGTQNTGPEFTGITKQNKKKHKPYTDDWQDDDQQTNGITISFRKIQKSLQQGGS